jgi:hypothetical protein
MSARLWLVVSIAFNVFAAVCLYVALEPLHEAPAPQTAPYLGPIQRTNVVVRRENFTWAEISSTNYIEFIKNLRAIGCPEQTIADIVSTEINHLYGRRRVTEVVYPNYQWWRSDPDPDLVAAATAKIRSLDAERRELLESLLGPNWNSESKAVVAARAGITLTGPVLGDMPLEIKEAAFIIIARAQEKIEAYQEAQAGQGKPVDPMEMVRLREEPFVQLVTIMTPPQYDEFVLRYSPAAQQLREEMRGMDLTADQFRDLFNAVGSILGQPVYFYSGEDPQLLKQQQQLQTQRLALMKTVLDPQIFAAYQLNQDPIYRSSKAVIQQVGAPASAITPLYEITRATQVELDRIRNDDTLSNEQLLGPDAFQRWLQEQASK